MNNVLKAGSKITVEAFEGEIIGPASDFISPFLPPYSSGEGFYKVRDDQGVVHYVWVDRDGRVKAAREPLEFRAGDIWEVDGTEWIVITEFHGGKLIIPVDESRAAGEFSERDNFEDFEDLNPVLIRRKGE